MLEYELAFARVGFNLAGPKISTCDPILPAKYYKCYNVIFGIRFVRIEIVFATQT